MNAQAKAAGRRVLSKKLFAIIAYGAVLLWMLSLVFAEAEPRKHGQSSGPAPISSEFDR